MTQTEAKLNRREAIRQGFKHYQGRPCKNCHNSEKCVIGYGCTKCAAKSQARYREAHPEHGKLYYLDTKLEHAKRNQIGHLRRKYNMTIEAYDVMVKEQKGLCYICHKLPTSGRNKKLVIDHDHETGLIRRLLCDQCNRLVGYLHEDCNFIMQIYDYVNFYKPHQVTLNG